MYRDVPGWGAYFWAYEFMKQHSGLGKNNQSATDLLTRMVVAGLSGQFSWLVSYPFDVVKTIVQTSDDKLRMRDVFRDSFKREGARFFFKGFGPTLLRTFVVNMVTLPTFDYLTINFVSQFAD